MKTVKPRTSVSEKRSVTASELMGELQQAADFALQRQRRNEQLEALRAEAERAAAPILTDLLQSGFAVESIADLYTKKIDYKEAIPLLIQWLPKVSNSNIKESIVRALSVRWARPIAAAPLIKEFRAASDLKGDGIKWAIANALSVVADGSVLESLVSLVRDKRHGKSREMLALALANMRSDAVLPVLSELLEDEPVAGHAIMALGKLKAQSARPLIEPFLQHKEAWVRKEAKKALAKIDKESERVTILKAHGTH